MSFAPEQPRDPIGWSGLIAFAFLALLLVRLGIPTKLFFDEVHYVPAARVLISLSHRINPEHPLVGKEMIGLGIMLFGDNPWGWRLFSALAGAITLYAFIRALWFATLSRFATLAGGILLATDFLLFVQSRIAMLDIFMVVFALVAIWQCAGALREPETARWRFAIAGVCLGLSLGAKWNPIPVAILPGLTFLVVRFRAAGTDFLTARRGWPIPGMTLLEAGIWLGLVPLLVYALTFTPSFFYAEGRISPWGLIAFHKEMVHLQDSVVKPHPYQSVWWQWVLDWRPIWYLYEQVDGAQRGVIMLGNPVSMWLGLPALLWCGVIATDRRNLAAFAVCVLYLASLALWIIAAKPVQFYYHYVLPSCFLVAALAIALDDLWKLGWRKTALGTIAASCLAFAYFYPVLSAAPLAGEQAFLNWTWFQNWR